jgi:hypothetical protein
VRRGIVVTIATFLLALTPTIATATAWSPLTQRISVGVNGTSVLLCTDAGIIDVAKNQSEDKVRSSTGTNCPFPSRVVPSGYLAVSVAGYRDGAYCGDSGNYYSNAAYSDWWVTWQACSNPSGSQTFYTDGRGAIWNDGSLGGAIGYYWFHSISPSQNY